MPEAAAVSLASRGRRSDGATETGVAARPPDMGFISPWKSRGLGRGTLQNWFPKVHISWPVKIFHADILPVERTGNPTGFHASKRALRDFWWHGLLEI